MNVTETTPKNPARTFSIELNENEAKLMGIIMGNIIPNDIRKVIEAGDYRMDGFTGAKYESSFIATLFQKLYNSFNNPE